MKYSFVGILQQKQTSDKRKFNVRERFKKYKSMASEIENESSLVKIEKILEPLGRTPADCSLKIRGSLGSTGSEQSCKDEDTVSTSNFMEFSVGGLKTGDLFLKGQQVCNSEVAEFMKQFHNENGLIPNFNHPMFDKKQELKKLQNLVKICKRSIEYILDCATKIKNKKRQLKLFTNQCFEIKNISNFINSKWQNGSYHQIIKSLKPTNNFIAKFTFQKVFQQLHLILSQTLNYEIALCLSKQISLSLFLKIKENLLEIEQKLLLCSHSIYQQAIADEYPHFYYQYLNILKDRYFLANPQQVKEIKETFEKMWEVHEPVTCSQIGRVVWDRLNCVIEK